MATFTDAGLVIDNIPTIRANLQAAAQLAFADIVPSGQQLDVDDSSVMGRIIGIMSVLFADYEEALQQLYASKDINQATGLQLETLCALGGVYRKKATPSEALLMLYATYGTIIAINSNVASSTTKDVFQTQAAVTCDNNNINGCECTVDSVGTATTYTIAWVEDNSNVVNEPITYTSKSTDTVEQICAALISNVATDKITCYKTNDNLFGIYLTDRNTTGSFTLTNLSYTNIYKPVDSLCTQTGALQEDADTITSIQSPASGWLGVTNPFAAVEGSEIQTDEELRLFYHDTKTQDGASTHSAMYAALIDLKGVKFVNIQENTLDTTINGIPSHSIAVVVLGGDDSSIGQAILDNVAVGIGTVGDVTTYPLDVNKNPVAIQHSRPDLVPIAINMTLTVYPDFPENGANLIRQAIIDYIATFNVGDDVLFSRLFTPINSVSGFAVNNLSLGRAGSPLTSNNIVLNYNELANISYENITFGGI